MDLSFYCNRVHVSTQEEASAATRSTDRVAKDTFIAGRPSVLPAETRRDAVVEISLALARLPFSSYCARVS